MKYTTNYESETYFVGAQFNSNDCGKVEILGKIYRKGRDPHYVFKFLDTGTVAKTEGSNIKKGSVRDFNKPSVLGIGYIGYGKHKTGARGRANKQFSLWNGMLTRCYGRNPKHESYRKSGITVCERWHSFQNFCDDLPSIEGYSQWLKGGMSIDKDLSGNKVYAPHSVKFISVSNNSKERQQRVKTVITVRDKLGRIVSTAEA